MQLGWNDPTIWRKHPMERPMQTNQLHVLTTETPIPLIIRININLRLAELM